ELALPLRECVVRFCQSAIPRWRLCRNGCLSAIVAALSSQRHSAGGPRPNGAAIRPPRGDRAPVGDSVQDPASQRLDLPVTHLLVGPPGARARAWSRRTALGRLMRGQVDDRLQARDRVLAVALEAAEALRL